MGKQKFDKNKNVMLSLMYDGTEYNGWQRSESCAGKKGIQGLVETALSNLLSEKIAVNGSGRTDAGVHALCQVCNFTTGKDFDSEVLPYQINQYLPDDIKVTAARQVSDTFHARYDAAFKIYEYRIDVRERENVFSRKYAYPVHQSLDINQMQEAAKYLIGTHDFKAFSTDRKDGKSTVRTIHAIEIYEYFGKNKEHEVRVQIRGNGFLHHMVRIIAGTLMEAGQGKRSCSSVKEALDSRTRSKAGILLYPQGLFLQQVGYPYDVWDNR